LLIIAVKLNHNTSYFALANTNTEITSDLIYNRCAL